MYVAVIRYPVFTVWKVLSSMQIFGIGICVLPLIAFTLVLSGILREYFEVLPGNNMMILFVIFLGITLELFPIIILGAYAYYKSSRSVAQATDFVRYLGGRTFLFFEAPFWLWIFFLQIILVITCLFANRNLSENSENIPEPQSILRQIENRPEKWISYANLKFYYLSGNKESEGYTFSNLTVSIRDHWLNGGDTLGWLHCRKVTLQKDIVHTDGCFKFGIVTKGDNPISGIRFIKQNSFSLSDLSKSWNKNYAFSASPPEEFLPRSLLKWFATSKNCIQPYGITIAESLLKTVTVLLILLILCYYSKTIVSSTFLLLAAILTCEIWANILSSAKPRTDVIRLSTIVYSAFVLFSFKFLTKRMKANADE
ncbi:MAG: hypothetical protein LC109_01880 [Bacteroidia bacterium]|nr:hypothetical protein [Bacteroidia bacterium]